MVIRAASDRPFPRVLRWLRLCVSVLALLIPLFEARAQQQIQRIAVVVNDTVISLRDVQERMALAMVSSSLPNTAENQRRILPSIVRTLVDDRLRLQEAERVRVTVSEQEIKTAIHRIEASNHMQQGSLAPMLQRSGVPLSVLEAQVRPQIAWAKVAQVSLRRDVFVQPEEVEAVLAQLKESEGRPQNHLAELVLPVTSPDQEQQTKALADRLVEQLRGGARFSDLARQFSATATAARGGDLGWTVQGQLPTELEPVVARLQPGQVSAPVRTASGYTVLLLIERRVPSSRSQEDGEYHLSQLYMPTVGNAAVSPIRRAQIENEAKTSVQSCQDMNALADRESLSASGDIGFLHVSDLPAAVAKVVQDMKVGVVSPRIVTQNAAVLVMVCEKKESNDRPSRAQITKTLEREDLERLAERRLRDLRRQALIDIRL